MSMQLAFGHNAMSPVVAKMVTDKILETARNNAAHDIAYASETTRDEAAYHIMYQHLFDNFHGAETLEKPLVDEMRKQYPDAADEAADSFHAWVHNY